MAGLAVQAADIGLAPVVAGSLVGQMALRAPAASAKRASLTCKPCLVVARDEDRAMIAGLEAVAALDGEGLSHIPVAVIASVDPRDAVSLAWRDAQRRQAAKSDRAWVLEVPRASHVSPLIRDRDYIEAAVGWLRSLRPQP